MKTKDRKFVVTAPELPKSMLTSSEMLEIIRGMVAKNNLSEVAAFFDVSIPYMSDVNQGKRDPGPSFLNKLGLKREWVYRRIRNGRKS